MATLAGLVIGFYDGLVGPGTGSFLLIVLVAVLGYSFLNASATAKVVNLGTNLAAIVVFGLTGSVLWLLGLLMGACNVAGAVVGAGGQSRTSWSASSPSSPARTAWPARQAAL